jgi:hypothetical protein
MGEHILESDEREELPEEGRCAAQPNAPIEPPRRQNQARQGIDRPKVGRDQRAHIALDAPLAEPDLQGWMGSGYVDLIVGQRPSFPNDD